MVSTGGAPTPEKHHPHSVFLEPTPAAGAAVDCCAAAAQAAASPTRADVPRVLAEVTSCFLWVVIVLLVASAFGLFKVKPPGEDELCVAKTLGLTNVSHTNQEIALGACHRLYGTVFVLTRLLGGGFLTLCVVPLGYMALGRAARSRRRGVAAACYFTGAAVMDAAFGLLLGLLSYYLLSLSATVTLVMGPITAEWLAIYAAYFGMKASHHTPPHWLEIVYKGYVACWYTDTFMWIGTMAVLLLSIFSTVDFIRNFLAALGFRPRDDTLGGSSEVCRLRRVCCSKVRGWCLNIRENGCQCSGGCCSRGMTCQCSCSSGDESCCQGWRVWFLSKSYACRDCLCGCAKRRQIVVVDEAADGYQPL